jgi:hypothetical protein
MKGLMLRKSTTTIMKSGAKLHSREPRERGTLAANIAEDPKDKAMEESRSLYQGKEPSSEYRVPLVIIFDA